MEESRKNALNFTMELAMLLDGNEQDNEAFRIIDLLFTIADAMNLDSMMADDIAQWPRAA